MKNLREVQKERDEAISLIKSMVQQAYPPGLYVHTRINVSVYGSMASGLAIDTSDIDLAVTGHTFNGDRNIHTSIM